MWRMQDGDRVLSEAEWEVFCIGLDLLRDSVEQDISDQADDTSTGVPTFDRLTAEQKLLMLAEVALALRDPEIPTPFHTAVNEGTIAGVFSMIRAALEAEIESIGIEDIGECNIGVRRLLRALAAEYTGGRKKLPSPTRLARGVWDSIVEDFEVRVFWDYDFDMGDAFLDLPPEQAQAQLELAGIDPDYYLETPAEPREKELIAARQTLARLLGLVVPDDDGLYPTLVDLYHDLSIGPITPEVIAAWEDNSWIEVVGSTEPDWDCDHRTWVSMFSKAVPYTPFEVASADPDASYMLPGGVQVERFGELCVLRDEQGAYWCGLVDNGWTLTLAEDVPALTFPTEADALAAFLQANRMYGERAVRHEQAIDQIETAGL